MIDPRPFRESTRSASVSYPVPFILVALLSFCLSCFAGAAFVDSPLRWVFVATGGAAAAFGLGLVAYAVIRRPELLKSERHSLAERYLAWLSDPYLDDATRKEAGKVLPGLLGPAGPKRLAGRRTAVGTEADDHER